MNKSFLQAFFTFAIIPSFLVAADIAPNTATASAVPVTITASENIRPAIPATAAVGIDLSMINKAIPGFSYTKILSPNTTYSVFAGAIYDGKIFMMSVEAYWYYLINEYLYVGIGASALLDEGGYAVFGFANPAIGIVSAVTDNIKFYLETNILIISYRTRSGLTTPFVTDDPTPVLKLGVRYYF